MTITLELNDKQQEAINTLSGPVLVLAGPGTGKTRVITERIKNLIEKGNNPERILAITLTNAGASEMKKRLTVSLGDKASRINISTIHSFCADLIKSFSDTFEFISEVNVCDEVTQYRLIQEVLDEMCSELRFLKTDSGNRYFYVKDIKKKISTLKKECISKTEYMDSFKGWLPKLIELESKYNEKPSVKSRKDSYEKEKNKHGKAKELWTVYELYLEKLKKYSLIDYDDMIALVLNKIENDVSIRDEISRLFDHILVDEYQDSNNSQNKILFALALANSKINIFVVGDDDQSIYRFQGASTKNFDTFLDTFTDAKVVCLTHNYRSTQNILDNSYRLITQDIARLEVNPKYKEHNICKKLEAKNNEHGSYKNTIILRESADRTEELTYIADEIEKIVENNTNQKLSEIAILARKNKDLTEIGYFLDSRGIKYQIGGRKNIFINPAVRAVVFFLNAIAELNDDQAILAMFSSPLFNIDNHDLQKITLEKHKHRNKPLLSVIKELGFKDKEKINFVVNLLEALRKDALKLDTYTLIINLYNFFPFLQLDDYKSYQELNIKSILEFFAEDLVKRLENIAALKKFADLSREFFKNDYHKKDSLRVLKDFLEYLDIIHDYDISIEVEEIGVIDNAVQLFTVHDSKGREFEHVFLTNLNSNEWEKISIRDNLKLPIEREDKEEELNEERRLIYVALTRAKKELYLTRASKVNDSDKSISTLLNPILEENPTIQIINSLQEKEDIESNYEKTKRSITRIIRNYNINKEFDQYLSKIAQESPLSSTALNTYLACPNKFKYNHIYRVPTAQITETAIVYGNCAHKALEKFWVRAKQTNTFPTLEELNTWFREAMDESVFRTVSQKGEILERGIAELKEMYTKLKVHDIKKVIGAEVSAKDILFDGIRISGKFDLMEYDESKEGYIVTDYKTGEPQTEGDIKGTTKGSKGEHFNQLKFYKLLGILMPEKYKVIGGRIWFLKEADKPRDFILSNEDLEDIKSKIKEVSKSIQKANFTPVSENQTGDECRLCGFKRLCAARI